MIVVRGHEDGLVAERWIGSQQQAGHVPRRLWSCLLVRGAEPYLNAFQQPRRGRWCTVDLLLPFGGRAPGRLQKRSGDVRRHREPRDTKLASCKCLLRSVRPLRRTCRGTVAVHRLGDHEHRSGAVALGIPCLRPGVGVQREPRPVEDGFRVVLLRFVIEDEHRLARHVQPGVVVVTELRRRDAVTGEDDGQREIDRLPRLREEDAARGERLLGAIADNMNR